VLQWVQLLQFHLGSWQEGTCYQNKISRMLAYPRERALVVVGIHGLVSFLP